MTMKQPQQPEPSGPNAARSKMSESQEAVMEALLGTVAAKVEEGPRATRRGLSVVGVLLIAVSFMANEKLSTIEDAIRLNRDASLELRDRIGGIESEVQNLSRDREDWRELKTRVRDAEKQIEWLRARQQGEPPR